VIKKTEKVFISIHSYPQINFIGLLVNWLYFSACCCILLITSVIACIIIQQMQAKKAREVMMNDPLGV